jgi:hypothetical protein
VFCPKNGSRAFLASCACDSIVWAETIIDCCLGAVKLFALFLFLISASAPSSCLSNLFFRTPSPCNQQQPPWHLWRGRFIVLIEPIHHIQDDEPHGWSSASTKRSRMEDLHPLVVTTGLLLDSPTLLKHPANGARWSKERGCPTCAELRLVFKRSKPQTRSATATPAINCFFQTQRSTCSKECPAFTHVNESSAHFNLPSLIWQITELLSSSHGRLEEISQWSRLRPTCK